MQSTDAEGRVHFVRIDGRFPLILLGDWPISAVHQLFSVAVPEIPVYAVGSGSWKAKRPASEPLITFHCGVKRTTFPNKHKLSRKRRRKSRFRDNMVIPQSGSQSHCRTKLTQQSALYQNSVERSVTEPQVPPSRDNIEIVAD